MNGHRQNRDINVWRTIVNTLTQPRVAQLLTRLYEEAAATDERVRPAVTAAVAARSGAFDDQAVAPLLDEAFMAVAPEVGRLLYLLVRNRRPARVVEFGTSLGLSAIHLAAALRDNGHGRLVTTELNPAKAERATAHLRAAELDDLVEVRQGDAFVTLAGLRDIDLLLLDGWKALYLPLLRQLEPALAPGCLVIADDTCMMPEVLAPYLAYVRDPAQGYTSCAVPLDDGLELSLR
jgi:predicted O-methyltransferase YrrM